MLGAGLPSASILSDFWQDQLVAEGKQGVFLVLVGFLASFGFIRLSTRLMRSPRVPWWPGSIVSDGGVHLHHLVFGIVLMMAAGTLGFWFLSESPGVEICAVLFGIGVGLTIDEFALFVYLDDVYWAHEGRISIDATVIAVAAICLLLLGADPFRVSGGNAGAIVLEVIGIAIILMSIGIAFAKQRVMHGAIGILLFPLAVYAACRIGKPRSPWARRFYGERKPKKQAKAEHRFRPDRRTEQLKERFRDAVGGSTGDVYDTKVLQRGETEDAAAEVRWRADRVAEAENEAAAAREGPPVR